MILIRPKVFGFQTILWNMLSFYLLEDQDLFEIVRDVKVEFYKKLNYWKTTFDDVCITSLSSSQTMYCQD